MRGPGRVLTGYGACCDGGNVVGREQLQQRLVFCIHNARRRRAFGSCGRERTQWTAATGSVVVAVARIEPDLVTRADTKDRRIDMSVDRSNDYIPRISRYRAVRIPNIALRIEYLVAADEEVLLWTESQAGRSTELHGIGGLDCR